MRIDSKPSGAARRNNSRKAFSLIELLVVIALTGVLVTLLFGPLLQGFNLTNEAQRETETQNAARVTMEQISREIGSAALVRDTSHSYLDMWIYAKPAAGPKEALARAYGSYLDIEPARVTEGSKTGHIADPTIDPTDPIYKLSPTSTFSSIGTNRLALNVEVANPIALPVAPAPTITRYFVGLRHPMNLNLVPGGTGIPQPYTNSDENQTLTNNQGAAFSGGPVPEVVANKLENTYILYRAQVSVKAKVAGGAAGDTYQYFDVDANGNPVLDDPDFFRIVTTSDINLHATTAGTDYTAPQVIAHNNRVYRWYQASHPILDVGNANLIFQTHDGSNKIAYNNDVNGYVAGTQSENDPVVSDPATLGTDGGKWPIVRTSVSFEPASVSNDSLSPTNSSDVSQGFGSAPTDTLASYVPSEYKAQAGQWAGSPNVSISVPNGAGAATQLSTYTYKGAPQPGYSPGDLIETNPSNTPVPTGILGNTTTDVYNVSKNIYLGAAPATGVSPFVAMAVNGDPGSVNFSMPDVPVVTTTSGGVVNPPSPLLVPYPTAPNPNLNYTGSADTNNVNNPYWFITFGANYGNQTPNTSYFPDGTQNLTGAAADPIPLVIHLKTQGGAHYLSTNDQVLLPNPPLSPTANLTPNIDNCSPTAAFPTNGQVVANSERIYGPEQEAGPGSADPTSPITVVTQMPLVLYRRIPFNAGAVSSIGPDQYMIDYVNGIVYLGSVGSNTTAGNINVSDASPSRRTVMVSYNWQNNAGVVNATTGQTQGASARASYETGSKIAISIGVRIIDPSISRPSYFSLTNAVTVGNATH